MKVFGIEVDTSCMSIEDLKDTREMLQEIIEHLDFLIKSRQMIEHKYGSNLDFKN